MMLRPKNKVEFAAVPPKGVVVVVAVVSNRNNRLFMAYGASFLNSGFSLHLLLGSDGERYGLTVRL
jgi:hypothetical protein